MDRPLLLIDVDGVISLFGFDPGHPPAGRFELVDGIAHFLSASAGAHLSHLSRAFELVWCTGWEDRANDYLPHALGLPDSLPHLTFDREPGSFETHWKLPAIDAYAGVWRPLAWLDDAHDEACVRWAAERPGPTLLLATEPAVGLTEGHVAELLEWAAAVRADDGPGRGAGGPERPRQRG